MMNLLDADSALPSFKLKSKHPAASSSLVATAEVAPLGPLQADLLPVSSGPSPPAPAALTPDPTELPPADANDPQAAHFKAHLIRRDAAESEVIRPTPVPFPCRHVGGPLCQMAGSNGPFCRQAQSPPAFWRMLVPLPRPNV